ncbi:hydroperoxide isomerase ALOXE3-like [Oncorhynchus tshawytscha]|uniref:Hydroperoxide isomerase ALOXE3-like n=1 Tax=Oncorhynchus tshawytscha TaxID=74940 RepID=A0AAZ3NWT0_ONCTS|nr:hydroperoxide isomerase ALOXE3-like [Oncorhynchus tshawytscha]
MFPCCCCSRDKSVIYKAEVFTGEMLHAGTTNSIYIHLRGTMDSSHRICLPKSRFIGGHRRGAVIELDVFCPSSLGHLEFVVLESEPYLPFCFLNDDWFCSKVVVTTPEGDTVNFPCYHWISGNERLMFREATGKLIFNETWPEAIEERKKELQSRQKVYRWSIYAEGLPEIMKVDSASDLPAEVRFSFTKDLEFKFTAVEALLSLKLETHSTNKKQWKSLDELSHVFNGHKTDVYEYVEKNWKEDEFFGYQLLNGLNPMMIHRCSKLPENFPVTEDMVKASLFGKNLEAEIQKGNIFLVDYKRLHGVTANVIHGKQHFLAAPLCLLYVTPEDKLIPIAIQLKQEPGEDNPIFLTTDSEYDWLLAKIFVRNADFAEHELNFHLLRTHLLAEVFAVSTLRNLPMVHPIYKLLISHFRYTLQINTLARQALISENGLFTENASVGGPGMVEFLKKAVASLTYSSLCMPEDITARGLESIPNFLYRDDGLRLWDIVHRFVHNVIGHYYTCDSDVQKDTELQNWIEEIFFHGFLAETSTGIPQSFSSVTELVRFITMVIFTVSVQHAAVNNGQFDFGGWMPNFPNALQQPPPTTKGKSTKSTMLKTFPDINTTINGMAAVYLLSTQSTDYVALGNGYLDHFSEKTPLELIHKTQNVLKKFNFEIQGRNVSLPLPYTYLNPNNVENSVAL